MKESRLASFLAHVRANATPEDRLYGERQLLPTCMGDFVTGQGTARVVSGHFSTHRRLPRLPPLLRANPEKPRAGLALTLGPVDAAVTLAH